MARAALHHRRKRPDFLQGRQRTFQIRSQGSSRLARATLRRSEAPRTRARRKEKLIAPRSRTHGVLLILKCSAGFHASLSALSHANSTLNSLLSPCALQTKRGLPPPAPRKGSAWPAPSPNSASARVPRLSS